MGNINSLPNKTEELEAFVKSDRAYRECCLYFLTETWLADNITDSLVNITGFTMKAAELGRKMDGKELNKDNSTTENYSSNSVTMETTEESKLAMGFEVEVNESNSSEQEKYFYVDDESVYSETGLSYISEEKGTIGTLLPNMPVITVDINNPEYTGGSGCPEMSCQKIMAVDQVDHQYLSKNVSTKPDETPCSADSIYENQPDLDPDAEVNSVAEDCQYLAAQIEHDSIVQEIPCEPSISEEAALQHSMTEYAMSDASNEFCHELYPEDMNESLRGEIAVGSSDSDTDEKWRVIFSSSINKEDDDSYLDSLQLSAQELFVQKVEMVDFKEEDSTFEEVRLEIPQMDKVPQQLDNIVSATAQPQELKLNHLVHQSLSKFSEDESENRKDDNNNHNTHERHAQNSKSDLTKKLPKDFCVIQETRSENVSTEHVDFHLARKQWQQMEEKNKTVLHTAKQLSFHSSHSCMYTPVRNIERAQSKSCNQESLNLAEDCTNTKISPCSDDSGVDDPSYRYLYSDLDTPLEREIDICVEQEEKLKTERGLSKMGKSTDCVPSQEIPSSPMMPSFIITSSPTKYTWKNEGSANIMLDPGNGFSSSPRQKKDTVMGHSSKWQSEDSSSSTILFETSSLMTRSASECSLNSTHEQPLEKMFLNNPFFKLRSRSTVSLVDEEIKMVKQREEELRKERANLYAKAEFSAKHMGNMSFDSSVDQPLKCKSSPTSPVKAAYKMDCSCLSCDHRM
ncbi:uncharacterized protein LOC117512870 [Thalassophryne amazonica]|uniref:uncharacterized protein LOC117512870 n=1 Tax=Thalassophryne amazonica TaxID=390379 RepID=UPI0014712B6A|nr:uncharacterized protein LOC117512870 [Thalassophryne amazonica]